MPLGYGRVSRLWDPQDVVAAFGGERRNGLGGWNVVIDRPPRGSSRDAAGIAAIDTSFTTRQTYKVGVVGDAIRLTLRELEAVLSKRYPLDDLEKP